jgi:hypothetical protein
MKVPEGSDQQTHMPGQIVPASGIYTAIHDLHRPDHEVVAIRGEEFPPCRICKDEVRFHIARTIPHMTHDFDLTGPASRVINRRAKAAKKGAD